MNVASKSKLSAKEYRKKCYIIPIPSPRCHQLPSLWLVETFPDLHRFDKLNFRCHQIRKALQWQTILISGEYLIHHRSRLRVYNIRTDTRFAPCQWETALLCNDVSQWLGASLKSSLQYYFIWTFDSNSTMTSPRDTISYSVTPFWICTHPDYKSWISRGLIWIIKRI